MLNTFGMGLFNIRRYATICALTPSTKTTTPLLFFMGCGVVDVPNTKKLHFLRKARG